MFDHLGLSIMISISELANDNPTAYDPKSVILVVGSRDEMKKAIN